MNKRLIFGTFCLILGFAIGTGLTSSYAKITRFRSEAERTKMVQKHKAGLTMEKLDERLKKVEADIKKLKRDKLNAKTN